MMKRFWNKVDRRESNECWNWQACMTRLGYGLFWFSSKNRSAHRVAWILTHGEIPNGLHVLHKCDNPACVNPSHLFLGTQRDNIHDAIEKGRHKLPDNRGERCGTSKLTRTDVLEIRRLSGLGAKQKKIAAMFQVSQSNISMIVNHKNWSHA